MKAQYFLKIRYIVATTLAVAGVYAPAQAMKVVVIEGTGVLTHVTSMCTTSTFDDCVAPEYQYKVGDEFEFTAKITYPYYWDEDNRIFEIDAPIFHSYENNWSTIYFDNDQLISADLYGNSGSDDPDFYMSSNIWIDGQNFKYSADEGSLYSCANYAYGSPDCQDLYYEIKGEGRITGVHMNGVQASAIPEPSSWALLIAGFGLAGCSLRRKQVKMA